ncbi:MAG: 3-deoxy-manno-octulosonate cytidylyltransferase [Acetobacter fabarum]|uniref:3-deoxy-manno-octulosonate cytidylyltransferase n=1 Tax=Acetobacter sp. DsW_54 TaxID=1670660 RepID=UPI000B6630FF|nr:3-deoxy-manno-octulosonate cytidylyltransferase [Acetobacter sp. DsW_54]MCI1242349.1 3-deoxy-manno-octulosonate cytidylyltransferase [Acetobacter fabarum]MCI1908185.1 3-deoxy-manno-octulosonate cytidylyltransferase [Acetobacter fabarum]MCI1927104.1 3-deoxy-manno-octulosonate cytidylyltransferase [Acetobacter fabarum]MCI1947104.1 3-deoxy-manno-octulosonate cytidylyltransferase [Acetobacter fabarum]MCI1987674.1 3-deoxy-manno-octulosonate cytidylyltransferase [Acetobacter fabarum]
MMPPLVVIPARLASTRLPGKPLADIAGLPMIVHVLNAALKAEIGPVVVAAAEPEICDVVTNAGGKAVLTDPDLPSGSDRVWQAVQTLDPQGQYSTIINLQGDLPTLAPDALHTVCGVMDNPAFDIGTLVAPVSTEEEATAPSVVKVACHFAQAAHHAVALYFSRQPIPAGPGPLWHHVGIYAWRRAALARFVQLPPSGLEQRESLEQLRALEDGMRIGCARLAIAPFGVDTPQDLERARRLLGA